MASQKKRFYSAHDQAMALAIVERYDGEVTRVCLDTIRQTLDAPALNKSTVYRWLQSQPVAPESQPEKNTVNPEAVEQALDAVFEVTARRYLEHANQDAVIADTKGKDAIMAAAIAVDKMRLLRNLPTEIVVILPDLVAAIDRAGLSASDVFNAMLQELALHDADGG